MKDVKIHIDDYKLPENWEELVELRGDEKVFHLVIQLAMIGKPEMNRSGWELLIKSLLGINQKTWDNTILSMCQWVYLRNECEWVFKLPLLIRPFETLNINGEEFNVPDLNDAKAIEMSMGLVYFTQYGNGDLEAADWLIAVFCRQKNIEYNAKITESNALNVAKIEPWKKMSVLKYLTDYIAAFINEYSDMFGEGGKPIYEHGEGWYYMLGNAVKAGYYRNIVEVSNAVASEVWGWMRNDSLENARSLAQNK